MLDYQCSLFLSSSLSPFESSSCLEGFSGTPHRRGSFLDCFPADGKFTSSLFLPFISKVQTYQAQQHRLINKKMRSAWPQGISTSISWCSSIWLSFFLTILERCFSTWLNNWNLWISPFLILASSCKQKSIANHKLINLPVLADCWHAPYNNTAHNQYINIIQSLQL